MPKTPRLTYRVITNTVVFVRVRGVHAPKNWRIPQ